MKRATRPPAGYKFAEPATCQFGDIIYPLPRMQEGTRRREPIKADDARILLFEISPADYNRFFFGDIYPEFDQICWMVIDVDGSPCHRPIVIGLSTFWLKKKE